MALPPLSFPPAGGVSLGSRAHSVLSSLLISAAAVPVESLASELGGAPALSLCILFFTAFESRLLVPLLSNFGIGEVGSVATDGASDATKGWVNGKLELLPLVEPLSAHTFAKHSDRSEMDESEGRWTGGSFASAACTEGDVVPLPSSRSIWLSKTSNRSSKRSM